MKKLYLLLLLLIPIPFLIAQQYSYDQIIEGIFSGSMNGNAANPAFGFRGDSGLGMYRANTDELRFSTAGSDRMTVLSGGNVGIGITNPVHRFHAYDNASSVYTARIQQAHVSGHGLYIATAGTASTTFPLAIEPATANGGFYMTGEGKVGLGTSTPGDRLEVAGGIKVTSSGIKLPNAGGGTPIFLDHYETYSYSSAAWTNCSGGPPTGTLYVNFIRIGRLVTSSIRFVATSTGTGQPCFSTTSGVYKLQFVPTVGNISCPTITSFVSGKNYNIYLYGNQPAATYIAIVAASSYAVGEDSGWLTCTYPLT